MTPFQFQSTSPECIISLDIYSARLILSSSTSNHTSLTAGVATPNKARGDTSKAFQKIFLPFPRLKETNIFIKTIVVKIITEQLYCKDL